MILIVGAGISGLYIGFLLLKTNIDFKIIEKGEIGGKIFTKKFKNGLVEHGPSVFHDKQKNILKLCEKLNIKLKYTKGDFFSYEKLLDVKSLKPKKGFVKDFLTSENFTNYYETEPMIFRDMINMVKNEGRYMYPVKGFGEIVKRLKNLLKSHIINGEVLKAEQKGDFAKVYMKTGNVEEILSVDKVIFCTTMSQLQSINLGDINIGKNLTTRMPTVRVYVYLNKDCEEINQIFKNKVIYKKDFGLTIKIDKRIVLLIYTDGENTKKYKIEKALKFFNLENHIEKIEEIKFTDAYDLIVSEKELPFKLSDTIYQSAFPDRLNQTWLEGNLIKCEKIVKDILND